jgi:hypothetical protein
VTLLLLVLLTLLLDTELLSSVLLLLSAAAAARCSMAARSKINLGAFFNHSRMPSVNGPRPILVKKLIA